MRENEELRLDVEELNTALEPALKQQGEALTAEQLRDATRVLWLREREDPKRRAVALHLAVALDHLQRAMKASIPTIIHEGEPNA